MTSTKLKTEPEAQPTLVRELAPLDHGDCHGVGANVAREIDPSLLLRDGDGNPIVRRPLPASKAGPNALFPFAEHGG